MFTLEAESEDAVVQQPNKILSAHCTLLCGALLMQERSLSADNDFAACREVGEFLSAWSELYGITADAGFLRAMSQKIQGANHSVRRFVAQAAEYQA